MQLLIRGNLVRLDILGHRFVYIALAQLTVTKAGAVADQLVGKRAADPGKQEIPHRVLQDRSVADLENVVQVGLVTAGPRLGEGHIAHAPGHLGQMLAGHLGIRLPGDAVVRQEAVKLRFGDGLPSHQIDGRLPNNADVLGRLKGRGHEILPPGYAIIPLRKVAHPSIHVSSMPVLINKDGLAAC